MDHIHIRHPHQLGKEDLRRKVEDIAEDLRQKLHVQCQWQGDSLLFKRPGAQGRIALADDHVEVSVKLGMLVVPMKDKIEAQIREKIEAFLV
jgi:putative polyhydroxyalkanoate system protein